MKPTLIKLLVLLLLATATATLHGRNGNRSPESERLYLLVKSFKGSQQGDDYVFHVVPSLYWEKVTYYILDKNKSVLGGGTLSAQNNTIVLSKYPKGEYSICLRSKGAAVNKTFIIN